MLSQVIADGFERLARSDLAGAERALQQGLEQNPNPELKARLHAGLAEIRRRQGRGVEGLAELDAAVRAHAAFPGLEEQRAELLHDTGRYEESLALYRQLIARDPFNVALHNDYNDLLYRLDRQEFLKSFDRAPPNRGLYFAKAALLMYARRHDEARQVFEAILAREPQDKHARTGLATCLSRSGAHNEAAALFDALIASDVHDANLYGNAASARLLQGEVNKALELCEAGTAIAPDNQVCLALKGTAWRLLGDERDEALNGYDRLIQVIDLEPPSGFADMAAFNEELNTTLDRLHPLTREHVAQSLRGGSQTVEEVFGNGHPLIDLLQQRIDAAVARYIADLPQDENHPFLSRRKKSFRYAGSWSSRLRDQGFHANHLHPEGWISSCYYVAVPDAVQDTQGRQGWIKFGEPDLAVTLAQPVRRAIEPVPGRLVLFPSFMWHGTVPFRSQQARTTIAFDAVPT